MSKGKLWMELISVFLLIVILTSTDKSVEGWRPRHFPKIGISEFGMQDEEDHHMWETDTEKIPEGAVNIINNGQTYIISEPILALTIDCNASYPIQWNFLNAEDAADNVYSVRIRMVRHAKDVYNPLTNSFTSQLQLYGDTNAITGQYVCFSTEHEDVQKKIYIFWQGDSPSSLIPQDRTEDVCVKADNTAVLPCRVSDPDARPKLYFEAKCNEKYKPVNTPYIKYDPRIGFTIDLSQYNGAFGRYKCAMYDDDSFPAYFNLKNETCAPRIFNDTVIGRASFQYNKKEQKIVCCSNSSRSPTLQAIFCLDPVSCKMREFRLFKNGNNGITFKSNGSCVYEKVFQRDSGLVRCKGDGVDVMRPFYAQLQEKKNESFNLYFDWNAIEPESLITMSLSTRKPVYDKQNVTINCDTSYFYFAEGTKWAIRWKNGSLEFLDSDSGIYEKDRTGSNYQAVRLPLKLNMTEILCYAPVWNTTEWINKTFKIDVRESVPPNFDENQAETINLQLNDTEQVIGCKAKGTPTPIIRWKKNNRTVLNENNMTLKRRNGTLFLTIHRVSHDSHGEYKCVASNLAGRVEKTFKIYVIDPGQPLDASAIAIIVVLVLILFGGMGFLLWRMQLQRKIITHLTGIVFRDVNSVGANNTVTPIRMQNSRDHSQQIPATNGGMEFSISTSIPAQIISENNHV